MKPDTYLSITTQIGCPVQCLKYCPQELITSTYKGDRVMTLDMFKNFLQTVPTSLPIYVGGFSEPLQNQQAIPMMEYATDRGHPIRLFTTLFGLKNKDVERLCAIPFDMVVLHLPDAEGTAHIPVTQEYLENLGYIMTHVKRLRFMNMGPLDFITNHREDVARGVQCGGRFPNKRTCVFMEVPRYELMPNGEMYFCCECSCLSMRIGSIYKSSYSELTARHKEISWGFRNDPASICQSCFYSEPYWSRWISLTVTDFKEILTSGRPLKETPPLNWIWKRAFA